MLKILLPIGLCVISYLNYVKGLYIFLMFILSVLLLPNLVSPVQVLNFFMFDELSYVMVILTLWISSLMLISSRSHIFKGSDSLHLLVLLISLILIFVFFSGNMIFFYISFEFSLLPITMMVLGFGYQPERLQASNYLVLYTVGASLPLMVSICYLHYMNGHSTFGLFYWGEITLFNGAVLWGLTILAFLVKTPMYFFHLWLPKAHVEAPVAGSMILAGLLLKLGGYGIFRFMMIFPGLSVGLSFFITSISIWGGVICSLICLRQVDIKSLIAYSSITHMGVMVGGIMSNSIWGWCGGLMMMISHGLVSSSMFLAAFMMYKVLMSRMMYFIKGLMSVIPMMSLILFLSMSANMGVPPTLNLQSELMIVASIMKMSYIFLLPVCLSLFFSAAYSLFLYSSSQNGSISGLVFNFFSLSFSDLVAMGFHLFPAFFFIVKGGFLIDWLVV